MSTADPEADMRVFQALQTYGRALPDLSDDPPDAPPGRRAVTLSERTARGLKRHSC